MNPPLDGTHQERRDSMAPSENGNTPSESTATHPAPHFVLCDKDKKPIAKKWESTPPSNSEVKAHVDGDRGLVGVIPGSVDCLVIDVDVDKQGDAPPPDEKGVVAVLETHLGGRPFWTLSTPSGGLHLWYRVPPERAEKEEVGNRKWEAGGYRGDIRCDHGYVILWDKEGFKEIVTGDDDGDVVLDVARRLDAIRPPRKSRTNPATNGHPQSNDYIHPRLDELDFSEGNRNDSLNEGVLRRASWDRPYDDIVQAARAAGLPERNITATVASASRAGGAELAQHPEWVRTRTRTPAKPRQKAPPDSEGKTCYPDKNAEALADALEREEVAVRYNTRGARVEVNEKDTGWKEMTDRTAADLRERIAEGYLYTTTRGAAKLRFGRDLWRDKLNAILRYNEVDAFIVDFLDALPPWEHVDRLDFYLDDLFNAGKSELVQWAGRVLLLGAIARAYHPGEKLDEIPVFVGNQGIGKTAFLRALLPEDRPEWFADGLDLSGQPKEIAEALQGRVLVEVSEMAGSTGARLERLKAFLTRQDDGAVRLSYRENPEPLPRRAVMAGTTNRANSLPNDPSGNRRFVPVQLKAPAEAVEPFIAEILEQLWAEALHRYKSRESARLPRQLHAEAAKGAEAHRNRDELLESLIENELEAKRGIGWTSGEWAAACHLCDCPEDAAKVARADQNRLATALENKGLQRKRGRRDGQLLYLWIPAETGLL